MCVPGTPPECPSRPRCQLVWPERQFVQLERSTKPTPALPALSPPSLSRLASPNRLGLGATAGDSQALLDTYLEDTE